MKRGRAGCSDEGRKGPMHFGRSVWGHGTAEWPGVAEGLVWEGQLVRGAGEEGENRGPGGSGVREDGADVGRGVPHTLEATVGKGRPERPKGAAASADLQRMVWKEARGRFSKLSPSRRQCSSRSSSGFAVPFMAPHGPRARTGALPARPPYELPAPACGRAVLPGHRSAAHRDSKRRPPSAGSKAPPRRVGGSLCGSRATGLPASARYFRARSGSGGGGAMAIELRRDSEVLRAGASRLRAVSRRLPSSVSEAGARRRAECARPCPSRGSWELMTVSPERRELDPRGAASQCDRLALRRPRRPRPPRLAGVPRDSGALGVLCHDSLGLFLPFVPCRRCAGLSPCW